VWRCLHGEYRRFSDTEVLFRFYNDLILAIFKVIYEKFRLGDNNKKQKRKNNSTFFFENKQSNQPTIILIYCVHFSMLDFLTDAQIIQVKE